MPRTGVVARSLLLIAACASCGDVAEIEAPPLESAPWLLTHELREDRITTLRAHRVVAGKAEHVLLSTSALMASTQWSRSGRMLAYDERGEDGEHVWIRRFDGERWYEPQLVAVPPIATWIPGHCTWSPSNEQLLCGQHSNDGTIILFVTTVNDDGTITTKALPSENAESARWAPGGDRVLVTRIVGDERRFSIVDVPKHPDALAWSEHPITPPAGMTLSDIDQGHDETGISHGTISSDGRWIVFVLKDASDGSRSLYAFSTAGEGPPRRLESCPVDREGPSDRCKPESWQPEGATLLVERRKAEGGRALDAWSPDTGEFLSLGDVRSGGWLSLIGSRLLAYGSGGSRLTVVELRGGASPISSSVPTTDQPTFRLATASLNGRWLLLTHDDGKSRWLVRVDLSKAPFEAREIYRNAAKAVSGAHWSSGGRSAIVREQGDEREFARARLIDLESSAETEIEIAAPLQANGSPIFWDWSERLGPDDRTLAIGRDGALAFWKIGSDTKTAVAIEGVPASTRLSWAPVRSTK